MTKFRVFSFLLGISISLLPVEVFSFSIRDVRILSGQTCPPSHRLVTFAEANKNLKALCNKLGVTFIARLADGGAMDGAFVTKGSTKCKTRSSEPRGLGHAICITVPFDPNKVNVVQGSSCPSNQRIVTPNEANKHRAKLCKKLGNANVRLADGGSLEASSKTCIVRNPDTRSIRDLVLKSVLCIP